MSDESLTEEKGRKVEDIKKEAEKKECPVQKTLYLVEEFINSYTPQSLLREPYVVGVQGVEDPCRSTG